MGARTIEAIFRELEFRSLIDMLPGEAPSSAAGGEHQLSLFGAPKSSPAKVIGELPTRAVCVQEEDTLDSLVKRLESASVIAFDTETTSTNQMVARLVGISLAIEPGEGFYIPVGHTAPDEKQLPLDHVIERLRPAMTNPNIQKIAHNVKYDATVLERHGLCVEPLSFDTMVAQWLLYPDGSRGKLGLKAQAFIRLGIEMTEITELIGSGKNQLTMDSVPVEQCSRYAAADADMTLRLHEPLRAELAENKLESLFFEIEMPLVPVLCAMEQAGVLVDIETLGRFSKELAQTIGELNEEICRIIGYQCNLNSPQQLSDALFGVLGLPTQGLRKTRTGFYSTAADVLDGLREVDTTGVINMLMQFRELEKLRGTYVDALPSLVNPKTGRIHTSFNQTTAVTGRLSSSDPNLQNIPIRTDIGRRVRDAFIAAPGCKLVGADYSQVELRILAHVTGDEGLRAAFHENQDIHATTAAVVYGIPVNQVNKSQRSFAKSVNFGVLYGMGAYRLARESNLTLAEAEDFIRTYFERFPKVRQYLDRTRRMAIEQGYVETLLGRRRHFPDLQGFNNRQEQARAEREAINMPIQGTAADIIKIAMIRLHHRLKEEGFQARMILQVHDELLLEVPDQEAEAVMPLVKQIMEDAYPMDVPLRADVGIGQNWGEIK
jgi:DNA polymerase-1